jgi:drug/metabolite transporter (DMT)-like permease
MDGQSSRRGHVAIAASAMGYGVGTALSVVALHGLRPADLLDTLATVLLAGLCLRERIGAVTAAALALGTAGTALVALNAPDAGSTTSAGSELVGNLLVLTSVLAGAGYVVWSRRTASAAEEGADDSIGRTAWQFVGATVAVSPSSSARGERAEAGSPRPILTSSRPRPPYCSAAWAACSRSTSGSAGSAPHVQACCSPCSHLPGR